MVLRKQPVFVNLVRPVKPLGEILIEGNSAIIPTTIELKNNLECLEK